MAYTFTLDSICEEQMENIPWMHIFRGLNAHHDAADVTFIVFRSTRSWSYLKAARYSASPMGGSRPPVHAIFTLKPSPAPEPTWTPSKPVKPDGFSNEKHRNERRSPQQATHCQGRNCHCHSDEAKYIEHSGRCKTLPECHFRGEHPSNRSRITQY